jgi:hypothetical protein
MTSMVFALHYPVEPPPPKGGLSTGAKAGIGAGVGILGGILLAALVAFIAFRRREAQTRQHRKSSTGMSTSSIHQEPAQPPRLQLSRPSKWRPARELQGSTVVSPIEDPEDAAAGGGAYGGDEKGGPGARNWFPDWFPSDEKHPAERVSELP